MRKVSANKPDPPLPPSPHRAAVRRAMENTQLKFTNKFNIFQQYYGRGYYVMNMFKIFLK